MTTAGARRVEVEPERSASLRDHGRDERQSIGELISRAIADAKGYATAQVEVVKQTALTAVDKAKIGIALIVAAALLALIGLIILIVAVFVWLAGEIGPIGAGLVVAGVLFAAAFVMIKIGTGKLSAATAAMKNGKLK